MENVIPFEVEYPEAGNALASICQTNAKLPKKDRLIVDFDTASIYNAVIRAEPKIERNSPCPCGSGKKYKKCCLGV